MLIKMIINVIGILFRCDQSVVNDFAVFIQMVNLQDVVLGPLIVFDLDLGLIRNIRVVAAAELEVFIFIE